VNWRDILVTAIVLGSVPYALKKPFVGLLVFSWLAYMRVQDLCWSFARTMRFSYYIGIVMFVGFFVFEKKPFYRNDLRINLMLLLAVLITLSTFSTKYEVTDDVVQYWIEYLKIIAIAMITVALVDTPERLRMLVWTIALSLGFFGVKSGLWGILTGGGKQILRGPGGLLQDNNDFSLGLTMNLPFLFYLGLSETDKWVKRGLLGAMALTCVTILLTHSRGGFLAMAVTLGLMTWRSRNRFIGIGLAMVAAVMFLFFAPASVKERISSIKNYEEDSSAQARFHTWGIALKMASANPLLGVGFRNFRAAFPDYDPDPIKTRGGLGYFVAHNSYLQLSAESGFPAILLYLSVVATTLWLLRRVRIKALRRFETGWILNYVRMFEASLIGFLVGAVFLNRAHFDFAYHLISIIVAFGYVAEREMASTTKYPLRAGVGVARVHANKGTFGSRSRPHEEHGLGADEESARLGVRAAAKGALAAPPASRGFGVGNYGGKLSTGFRPIR
jgi:probable O-glycosylation ligase (exosortase A-associated)